MACVEEQQPNFKHFCRVCKKGFMCGRALGGHMRAHGIGDESANIDYDDLASDWEDKLGGNDPTSNKRMYSLRTNPNRLKSCRICKNCGKEFLSWKSFLEHGKCNCSDDVESLVSSPESDENDDGSRRGCGWSKRKRSLRVKLDSSGSMYPMDEDLILAQCLMSLSNTKGGGDHTMVAEVEESCASASKEVGFSLLKNRVPLDKAKGVAKGLFECKACKKVFNSHQALGGHRASHKKVKGCFAAKQDHVDYSLADDEFVIKNEEFFAEKSSFRLDQINNSTRKSKVHECSICHRIFSTGQALGGHKRCHWLTSNTQETSSLPIIHHLHDQMEQIHQELVPHFNKYEALDLNLPAPLSFEISTDIHLHPCIEYDDEQPKNDNISFHHQNNNIEDEKEIIKNNSGRINGVIQSVDDEADSKVKLAKLSELKEMNIIGSSSTWLKVGIGSTMSGPV